MPGTPQPREPLCLVRRRLKARFVPTSSAPNDCLDIPKSGEAIATARRTVDKVSGRVCKTPEAGNSEPRTRGSTNREG